MSLTLENLSSYIINKHFISFNLNVNKKYQQNICDNNINIENNKNLLNLVTNIKKVKDNEDSDSISTLSSKSNGSLSKSNKKIKNEIPDNYGEIHKIDLKLSNILDPEKYFIYTPHKRDSFIGSILSLIDIDYCSASEQSKKKMIQDFREKIGFDIDKNFKMLSYKRKIKKSDVQDVLLNGKYTDDNTHIYIGDLINKNLVIIYGMHEYRLLNEFRNERQNVILYYKNGIYCPLLNQDNQNFIDYETILKIKKMYSKKTFFNNEKKQKNEKYKKDIGIFIKNDMHDIIKDNNIETYGKKNKMNTEEVYMQIQNKDEKVYIKKEDFESIKKGKEIEQEIKMIKKMKIAELQAFAIKHNIDIYENSKKKLKKTLMEEIIQTIK
jgi:hypothetical protein